MERRLVRVYLCGAHSTGKTTLLGDVCKELPEIKKEAEIARQVLEGMSLEDRRTAIDFRNQPEKCEKFLRLVLESQCEVDRKNALNEDLIEGYIADRAGIDPLVYAASYLGDKVKDSLLSLPVTQECIKRYKNDKNALIFVVHPHKECMKEDGIRPTPVWNELTRYTEILTQLLDHLQINYIPITVLDRTERCQIVVNQIQEKLS
ncbi:uncharacterized protein [Antedon mediterranea]|uniref:uncharacterized protein n=1 Tax=Antedon mediterranea TaxID=105859 RepID=UPI003AF7F42C